MFQIIGAMAEFERSLIQERVKAGLRNAKAKGKKLGRPRADLDLSQVEALRTSGASWRTIAETLGVGARDGPPKLTAAFQKRIPVLRW
jgi:DNA invertase Pin-like site-specific DNA recombinase